MRKDQVRGCLVWLFSDPLSGFEPETYALQMRKVLPVPSWTHLAVVRASQGSGIDRESIKGTRKDQVRRGLAWLFVEPLSGFEPETYALRVRCSGHLS